MVYLRRIIELPSGEISRYQVISGPDGIINMDIGQSIPYLRIRELLKKGTEQQLISELEEKLELNDEEARYVADSLYEEKDRGKWEDTFEDG
jgi:hypothetical protein